MSNAAACTLALALLAALPTACSAPAGPSAAGAVASSVLEPCEEVARGALCGTYEVWEDRAAAAGRRIPLRVVVLPATSGDRRGDPLFLFAGGPGEASTSMASGVADMYRSLRRHRDLVLVDQRGTGAPHRLQCDLSGGPGDMQGYFEDFLSPAVAETCRRQLERIADLGLYTTSLTADDVDEVRAWLGYERINLEGGSYGTRLAQVYLRRHPERVRTAVLGGAVAMDQHLPLYHARDGKRAIDLLFARCAADAACAAGFPGLAAEHRELMDRLAREPARATVPDPATGEPVAVTFGGEYFAEQLRFLAYSPGTARSIPFVVHRAYQGDLDPFARLSLAAEPEIREALAFGLFLSVTCAEDLPFITPEAAAALNRDTYLGDYRVRMQKEACRHWVQGEIPPGFHEPVRSDAPVLLVSGDYDPVTPPGWAEAVAEHLPNALHVLVPEGHHSAFGLTQMDCLLGLVERFVEQGSAEGLDAACVERMERPPFVATAAAFAAAGS